MGQITSVKTIISRKAKLIIGLSIFVVLISALLRFTPLGQKVPLPQFLKNVIVGQSQEEKVKQENLKIIERVGTLIDLPKNEEPVIATVKDKDLLIKEQQFFQGAENGDILIIYPKAAKAMVYSPKRNALVNVGPLITSGAQAAGNTQSDQTKANENVPITPNVNTLKIELRNGTSKNGLASTVKQKLLENSLFEVIAATDAARKDYKKTLIINTGRSKDQNTIDQLSKVLGAQVAQNMPAEEKASSADILVILGSDSAGN